MPRNSVGTREEWLQARPEMLEAENQQRARATSSPSDDGSSPWVPIDEEYRFDTKDGPATLPDRFQAVAAPRAAVHDPGCPSCSSMADGHDGFAVHLSTTMIKEPAGDQSTIEEATRDD